MITVKMWKDICDFDPMHDGQLDIDGTLQRISAVKEKSIAELEEMPVSDLLPEFLDCVKIVNAEVFRKVDKLAKNAEVGEGK